ncbi:DALR domain-containing protein [Glutamicibacter arilaitensis]|uniref:DALR domain-containing protein n=1 Tax=Glutamicibacter arilaitensis TaxID=256701 RepID=UPI001CB9206D|nr:DALR domain-containing protein [Glutamicibacter arilaitensis]
MLDYRPDSLTEAGAAVERIDTFISNARYRLGAAAEAIAATEVPEAFGTAMDDDLNVPMALAALHETVRLGNASLDSRDDAATAKALGQVLAMTQVLGLDDAGSHESRILPQSTQPWTSWSRPSWLNARKRALQRTGHAPMPSATHWPPLALPWRTRPTALAGLWTTSREHARHQRTQN